MKVIGLVFFLVALYLGAPIEGTPRIIADLGYAEEGEFPYVVSLSRNGKHYCGGSILDEHWVLTSARCVDRYEASSILILAGTITLNFGGQPYKTDKYFVHESYNNLTLENDIALIKVVNQIILSDVVKPVELSDDFSDILKYAGWGANTYDNGPGPMSNELRWSLTRYSSISVCGQYAQGPLFDTQFCSVVHRGDNAVCVGDAGIPVTDVYDKQFGIVSWDWTCGTYKPDIYVGVWHYLDWIANIKANN